MESRYLYHKRSGFVYAVMINDNVVLIAAGPLSYNQATALNLQVWPFSYKAGLEDRINEHRDDYELYKLEEQVGGANMSGDEIDKTIRALLEQLPTSYPPAIFSRNEKGYWLEIERTIIFRGASGEDAIKHTTHYVQARKDSPSLPIGVIYGLYD